MGNQEEYISIDSIQSDESIIGIVKYKPYSAIVISIIFGILICLIGHPFAIVVGVVFILLSLYALFFIKDYDVLTVYPSYLLVHDSKNPTMVKRINNDDIMEWNCNSKDGRISGVMLQLTDYNVIFKDTFQTSKVNKYLNKTMKDKETNEKAKAAMKKEKISFKNPLSKKNNLRDGKLFC